MSAAAPVRASCRASRAALPLRGNSIRVPKVHPATGLPLSRNKGQHLIHNRGVVEKMVEAADIQSPDAVYEVGCGTGELTVRLLPLARVVHTVDVEERMVQETVTRAEGLGFTNLRTSVGDALRVSMPPRFDVCVANLPYQISSPFLFKILQRISEGPAWRSAVLMLQREFAERLLADPGEKSFSRLSLGVRLFARTERLFDVKSGSFIPRPRVESTVVRLTPRVPAPSVDFAEWDAFVKLIFSKRRRTLRKQFRKLSTTSMLEQNYKIWCSLAGEAPTPEPFPDMLLSVLEDAGLSHARAYELDLDDLHMLLRDFHGRGIHFVNVRGPQGLQGAPVLAEGSAGFSELGPLGRGLPAAMLRAPPPPPALTSGGLAYP